MIHQITEDNISILVFETGKGNAFSKSDLMDLYEKLFDAESNKEVLGLIITGSNRSFSIGGDVDSILNLNTDTEKADYFRTMDKVLIRLFSFSKPVISAINGHSIGFGFLMLLCADYVLAVDNKKIKFGLPEIKIGMAIDSIMHEILCFNNMNGKNLAKIIYSGDLFGIEKTLDLGVVDQIVSEADLLQLSKSLTIKLIQNNPAAFAANKNVLRKNSLHQMKKSFEAKTYTIFVELLNNIN